MVLQVATVYQCAPSPSLHTARFPPRTSYAMMEQRFDENYDFFASMVDLLPANVYLPIEYKEDNWKASSKSKKRSVEEKVRVKQMRADFLKDKFNPSLYKRTSEIEAEMARGEIDSADVKSNIMGRPESASDTSPNGHGRTPREKRGKKRKSDSSRENDQGGGEEERDGASVDGANDSGAGVADAHPSWKKLERERKNTKKALEKEKKRTKGQNRVKKRRTTASSEAAVQVSSGENAFHFHVDAGNSKSKKKRKKIDDKYLKKLTAEKAREAELKQSEEGKEVLAKAALARAVSKAQGEKLRDDPTRVKKTLKKKASKKKRSTHAWEARISEQEAQQKKRQEQRAANIKEYLNKRKANKVAKIQKRQMKRLSKRAGFEGTR